jgi:CelD/BcsL family acetyltransferase involved in cellulose biosynthesis
LHLVTFGDEGGAEGDLAGLAPLYWRGRELSLVGSADLCDYLDCLAVPGHEERVCLDLWAHLAKADWDTLSLQPLREDSLLATRLLGLARDAGYQVEVEPDEVTPAVVLPATWEEFLGLLAKKDRHELRRKQRRLAEVGEVRLECVSSPDEARAGMGDFLGLMGESRAEKALFLNPQREAFFREIAEALAEAGSLRLWFLEYNKRRVATALAFDVGGTRFLYNSGFDREYAGLSVGLLLKAHTIQDAIARGLRRYDFLRGNEPYKYDLGAKDVRVIRATVRRP